MFLKYFGGIEGGLMESNEAVTNQFIWIPAYDLRE